MTIHFPQKSYSVYRTITGFLLGVLLFVSFGIAPAMFSHFPHEQAGAVMQVIFPLYYWTIYACVLLGAVALLPLRNHVKRFWLVLGVLLFVGVFTVTNHFQILPMMEHVRDLPGREQFRKLHSVSMVLNLLGIIMAFLSIFLIAPLRSCNSEQKDKP